MSKFSELKSIKTNFYANDTQSVAKALLGKLLVRELDGQQLIGKIVETEAYIGHDDPASHAFRGKTPRSAIMFGPPGFAYVYFIYGMYFCLNVVTEAEGFPAAVLIRAVEPLHGVDHMCAFRQTNQLKNLTNGPGKLCQAFGIDKKLNGCDLTIPPLWIADAPAIPETKILATTRVGIRVGRDHLWRYCIKTHPFVSKSRLR